MWSAFKILIGCCSLAPTRKSFLQSRPSLSLQSASFTWECCNGSEPVARRRGHMWCPTPDTSLPFCCERGRARACMLHGHACVHVLPSMWTRSSHEGSALTGTRDRALVFLDAHISCAASSRARALALVLAERPRRTKLQIRENHVCDTK